MRKLLDTFAIPDGWRWALSFCNWPETQLPGVAGLDENSFLECDDG